MATKTTLRVAAVSDLHYTRQSKGAQEELFAQASEEADVLLLCGDLTDYGLPAEADVLCRDLQAHVKIPILAVLGNHDFESGRPEAVQDIVEEAGVTVLDGESVEVAGVGFAGARGFAGGFGQWALSAWGEPAVKAFVQAAIDEALKLEAALSHLHAEQCVVLLHYAPIRTTVEGEAPEVFPFLGSSRLEDAINRYGATAVFHGHAHGGSPEGTTTSDIPVYNVSIPVLKKAYPDRPPFRMIEIDLT